MEAFRRSVVDLDRAIAFYCDGLGFELDIVDAPNGARRAILTLGQETLELVALERPVNPDANLGGSWDLGFQHIAIVAADMPAAFAHLERFALRKISEGGPIMLPPSTGNVTAFKFRDPDGHPVELIHFPEGTGDPRWQCGSGCGITLGIDHSAVVVSDSDRSIDFYEHVLGFKLASSHINQGVAQDRLDGVTGAIARVVALAPSASTTPHLELLGYRRPVPTRGVQRSASQTSDRIVWAVDDLADILARLELASRADCALPAVLPPGLEASIVDPDGHVHCLIDRGPAAQEQE